MSKVRSAKCEVTSAKYEVTRGKGLLNTPYTLWAALFIVIPLVIVVYYAFTSKDGSFSLSNIAELSEYKSTFAISFWYSLIATVVSLIIAYPFSYIMSKKSGSSQRIQMLLVMLPMWMNLLIRTYSWMIILERHGVINGLLGMIGLPTLKMIGTPGAVILGMVYNYLPYMILPIYTIMAKIDPLLIEAASDLGCNSFGVLRRVIIPQSLPGVISGIIMVFVPSISTFYISQKLGGGKIMLIGDVIERQIQTSYNYNLGAALSFVLMVVILNSLMLTNKASGENGGVIV